MEDLNKTIKQFYIIDIYRPFLPTTAECIYIFSYAQNAFTKIDHILGHQASLIKLKKKNP